MQRSLLSHLLLVGGVSCLLAFSSADARGADRDEKKDKKEKTYEPVKFDTYDQVELRGRWYASPKGKKAPAVLILPKVGGDIGQDGWDRLAEALKEKGYSVLLFDYRGHGGSKSVSPDFWKFPNNNQLPNAAKNPPKESIDLKDFPKTYYPMFLNDIAAARLCLDRKNDAGECNTANLIVIGAEDGANLGMAWLYSEWSRYQINAGGKPSATSEGADTVCAIWLSFKPKLGGIQPDRMGDWFKLIGRDKKVPMYFIYGDGDDASKQVAEYYVEQIKANKKGHEHTGTKAIEEAGKVTGSELLQKNLKTQAQILKYIDNVMEDRGPPTEWSKRDVESKSYLWSFGGGRPIPAKLKDEKTLNLLPLAAILR
jgi:pimeloyl-ACP methyl ester carboxylesterase